MALPPGTTTLKIHPAIGFARLSTNPDVYEFGATPQPTYKSNNRIKRQAVRFRLFAYGNGNQAIEELTPARLAALGLRAVWFARVANRKVAKLRNDESYVISASAQSNVNNGRLQGKCGDFVDGQNILLGEIRPDGLFVPPLARVHSHAAGTSMEQGGYHNPDFTDNTCDGAISVELIDHTTNQPITVPTLDAWIVVAPQDFAPEWDDIGGNNLLEYLKDALALPNNAPTNPVNRQAREIDRGVLQTGTADFHPGIEVWLPSPPNDMFYPGATIGDPDEVRVRPSASIGAPGARPGELTQGLCSPWQFDFLVCTCVWWPNQRPDIAFREDENGPLVDWLRRDADRTGAIPDHDSAELHNRASIVAHVDELGIIRRQNDKRVEKERDEDIPPEVA
jgi:hypothetical protein